MREITECAGYQSLKTAVERDCANDNGTFHPDGCVKCASAKYGGRCFHEYCSKFAWVLKRAADYEKATGIPAHQILDRWEEKRKYWYMNYYQECKQPLPQNNKVRIFDTLREFFDSIESNEFRCPSCGGISTDPQTCNSGVLRDNGKPCDWKSYGLFGTVGKGVTIFIKEDPVPIEIFYPVKWEEKDNA